MFLLAMKAHCEAKHSVIIESVNCHASMWECMLWCALRSVMGCVSSMVCGLSLLGLSRTCPCFHDCGIHTCPSFQFITNPLTTSDHILSLNSFFSQTICGLLPVNLLAACQPHSLKRERWGLSRHGLLPGHVEWGLKESERGWV